jgi:hypothetical protein
VLWPNLTTKRHGSLFEIAEQQLGVLHDEASQGCRIAENTHPYHVQVGNWIVSTAVSTGSLCFLRLIGPNSSFGRCGPGIGTRNSRVYTATTRRSVFTTCQI